MSGIYCQLGGYMLGEPETTTDIMEKRWISLATSSLPSRSLENIVKNHTNGRVARILENGLLLIPLLLIVKSMEFPGSLNSW